jgi:glyoxylase-like metal-dependent hydrolase (beta-lactamase superfamily II)
MRLTLGDFELTTFSDGHYWLDGGAIFGVVPKPLWERKIKADELNRLTLGLNSLLVRTGKQSVLIETGIGDKLPPKQQQIYGNQARLLDDLRAGGVRPEDIDVVINTHLHFDHCGWNTMRRDGRVVATFPRAQYFVQEGEWKYAGERRERDAVSYISDNYDPLVASGQMELIHGEREIVPGIAVRVYPGHTRHMQAVLVHSRGQTACYISDLVPTTAHTDLTWVMAYDLFPLETIESRKQFYRDAIAGKWLVVFTHDPQTPCAYLEHDERGRVVAKPAGLGDRVIV